MKKYYSKNKSKFNNAKEKKKRALRNAARRKMEKKYGKSALRGKDVDHRKPLRSGGTNTTGNLRIMNRSKNRAKNGK